ncbi:glycosyltransferase family 2 protein [Altericroceibacterium xinjiangense]|uniref:glycosyltransferase family 2 protein n=1 Tax=Altericroceibacterium xinjiangense TaxID=762261 RepID=UPI000F7FA5A4|nr:glycosyltransferase family A protein [Altericroceibacterium xinjiangense]
MTALNVIAPVLQEHAGKVDRAAGFVIIGRNEGARLAQSLTSVIGETNCAVYVDSGSTDHSVALASSLGIPVVELDPAIPFTAARARNAGLFWLQQNHPGLDYVHFIDGDCELVSGWLSAALAALEAEPDIAAVCGRRRERQPEASPYNALCDAEWNTPVGLAETCGGDALFRVAPLMAVGGFSESLIAGEEPDLCHRIRCKGWRIRRIDADMTVHDAAMKRFSQWWQRNRRSGFATAEALYLRGTGNPRLRREVVSNVVWALPLLWPLWPLLWTRICLRCGPLQASFLTLGKLPHLQGQVDYWRKRKRLIEYK